MTAAPVPADEGERLAAVRRYDVLDTPPDGAFDRITALAARLLGVPIAIVSIVDTDRIWFKSHHGLEVDQVGREPGLCASAILQGEPWVVTDAAEDPRTLANPLVAGESGLRFYAGVPLTTQDGYNLGTLCVIDRHPRRVSEEDLATMRDLAALVLDELELRLSARRTVQLEAQLRQAAQGIAFTLQESLLPRELPDVPGVEIAVRYNVANRELVGGDFYDVVPHEGGCVAVVGDACGKGTGAASLAGAARWSLRTVTAEGFTPSATLARLNHVLVLADDDPERYCTLALAAVRPRQAGGADVVVALGGHPHPLVVRRDGTLERVGETAPPVGMLTGTTFRDVSVQLGPGDLLVMFTDGLLEVIGGHGSVQDRALRRLLEPLAGCPAAEVAARVDAELPPEGLIDDAAFLVIGTP